MAGRPSQLTDPLRERILSLIREGNYASDACSACGVNKGTYTSWINRGNADIKNGKNSAFAEFARQVKQARDEATAALVKTIKSASERQWQAAAWLLERTRPDQWADNRREIRALSKQLQEAIAALEQLRLRTPEQPPPTPPPPETPPQG